MFYCFFSYRNEIASCSEKAYTSLPLADAGTLLFFTNMADILNFAQEVRVALWCFLAGHKITQTQGDVLMGNNSQIGYFVEKLEGQPC